MKPTSPVLHFLPILVIGIGALFIVFIIHEYQRNINLINDNKSLISESAKTRLMTNLVSAVPVSNLDTLGNGYAWVKQKPTVYYFKSGRQKFPWVQTQHSKNQDNNKTQWHEVWADLNNLSQAQLADSDRLDKLTNIQKALATNDKANIQRSFDAFMQHKNAFILSPLEEIAFSLKLVDLGIKDHWNRVLIDAFLLTGGPQDKPIVRPVIDWLFKYNHLFQPQEFNDIIEKLTSNLKQVNLPSYYLDEYLSHYYEPQFDLDDTLKSVLTITPNSWLVQRSDKHISARLIHLEQELEKIKHVFLQLGLLQRDDTLFFDGPSTGSFNALKIGVNKYQLKQASSAQARYLTIKTLMLAAFIGLLVMTLRMVKTNHQRRLEYINLKEDFVKLVGHELKTPLSGIRAMAETLQKRLHRGLDIQSYPERIISESDKLWHMVDNILSFNRIQEEGVQLHFERINLKSLCQQTAEQISYNSEKQYQFHNSIADDVFCHLDIELFILVIKNILINAALYNKNDHVCIHFLMDRNSLHINDNGIGIDLENQKRVFEPFVRLPQSVRCSGSGIGLALCKKIIHLHGGEISIAQSADTGTKWAISLNDDR